MKLKIVLSLLISMSAIGAFASTAPSASSMNLTCTANSGFNPTIVTLKTSVVMGKTQATIYKSFTNMAGAAKYETTYLNCSPSEDQDNEQLTVTSRDGTSVFALSLNQTDQGGYNATLTEGSTKSICYCQSN